MLTCHAEQWGHNGVLLYNSTVARIRLDVLSPLMLVCSDWWCGWELIIFVLLVVGFFILVACCGIYFFFATRGSPYNVVMYDSKESKASQQHLIAKPETSVGILEPAFVTQTISNNGAFDSSLLSQHQTQQRYDINSNNEIKYQESVKNVSKEDKYQEGMLKHRELDENMIITNFSNLDNHNGQS